MKTRVQKWGNSLAVRIPKAFAAEAGLEDEGHVEMALRDGSIVITPVAVQRYDLARMLDSITPENQHREVETGPAAGAEVW
jgi:antitoxin MazE